jgi:hypothetical protein
MRRWFACSSLVVPFVCGCASGTTPTFGSGGGDVGPATTQSSTHASTGSNAGGGGSTFVDSSSSASTSGTGGAGGIGGASQATGGGATGGSGGSGGAGGAGGATGVGGGGGTGGGVLVPGCTDSFTGFVLDSGDTSDFCFAAGGPTAPFLQDADPTAAPSSFPIGYPRSDLYVNSAALMAPQLFKYDSLTFNSDSFDRAAAVRADAGKPHVLLRYFNARTHQSSTASFVFNKNAASTDLPTGAVFPGHWLYYQGTRLTTALAAATNAPTLTLTSAAIPNTVFGLANPTGGTQPNAAHGIWIVIYDDPATHAGKLFVNAEHMHVQSVTLASNQVSVNTRGFPDGVKLAHPANSVVAVHVPGDDITAVDQWSYDLATVAPRDGNAALISTLVGAYIGANYNVDPAAVVTTKPFDGVVFDSTTWFLSQTVGATIDTDDDLKGDDGIVGNVNVWGAGLEALYAAARGAAGPTAILSGGATTARGFDDLNGSRIPGFPVAGTLITTAPDYTNQDGIFGWLKQYTHHTQFGPVFMSVLNETPTKTYPALTPVGDPMPTDDHGFRIALGLGLLEDTFVGQNLTVDTWYDEFAVDETTGVPPTDDLTREQKSNWLGQPRGPYTRLVDITSDKSVLGAAAGEFEAPLTGWTSTDASMTLASGTPALDGAASLQIGPMTTFNAQPQNVRVSGPQITLQPGEYTMVFQAQASAPREVIVCLCSGTASALRNGQLVFVPMTPTRVTLTFTVKAAGLAGPVFGVGRESTSLTLDDLYIFRGSADVFRRDFDSGSVFVNASSFRHGISFGETLGFIQGLQDPSVNSGTPRKQTVLGANDAIVMLR